MCDLCARRSDLPQTENRRKMIERECPNAPMSEHQHFVRYSLVSRPNVHRPPHDARKNGHTPFTTHQHANGHLGPRTRSQDSNFLIRHHTSHTVTKTVASLKLTWCLVKPRNAHCAHRHGPESPTLGKGSGSGTVQPPRQAPGRRVKLSHKHLFLLPVVDSFMPSS